ncbi:MAG: hypothetical protein HOQ03_03695 [Thermoleophilia bacterium]|nr:hypothetical protein [Thermoleophilia bacterium]
MRILLTALAFTLAAPALAADDPAAFGIAQNGSFKLVSNVLLTPTGGEMKGVWLDGKRDCRDTRPLRVAIQIDLVSPAGKTTRVKRSRQASVDNCAEGGPNFGFDLKPKAYAMACANGRWKPGRYALTTRTTDVRTGLMAQASLYHQVTRRC